MHYTQKERQYRIIFYYTYPFHILLHYYKGATHHPISVPGFESEPLGMTTTATTDHATEATKLQLEKINNIYINYELKKHWNEKKNIIIYLESNMINTEKKWFGVDLIKNNKIL